MRTIIVSQDFPPDIGGIQTYTVELARRFTKYASHVSVIAPEKEIANRTDKLEPFHVHRIPSANTLLPVTLMPLLPVIAQKENPDFIFHTQWQTVVNSIWTKKWHDHKIITAIHGRELFFTPFPRNSSAEKLYLNKMVRILRQVDHFFPVSNYTRELLLNLGIPSEKMTLFNNGTDPDYFRPIEVNGLHEKLFGKKRPVIMTMARLVSWKGIDMVLKALPRIKKAIPDILYLIVGEGPDRKRLEQIISDLDLKDTVRFMGAYRDERRVQYYNLCDIFVLTSKFEYPGVEGFGIVFLEASACGKPVIGSRTGGIPDAIDEGKTGLLVEQLDAEALADAVINLLKNPDYAAELGRNGRAKVTERANWDVIGAQMFNKMSNLHKNSMYQLSAKSG
ncbi:MAG TPA: glycosyltransferase family 4 protein [Balneolales bacterium]|nr:glycosyltransferase family 4 protein [Balneolales bacterium]